MRLELERVTGIAIVEPVVVVIKEVAVSPVGFDIAGIVDIVVLIVVVAVGGVVVAVVIVTVVVVIVKVEAVAVAVSINGVVVPI